MAPVVIFRNRLALVGWGFAVVFLAFVVAMTYVALRDGVPDGVAPWLGVVLLIVFWVGALGFVAYAASQPIVRVSVAAGGPIAVALRYPFKTESREMPLSKVREVTVIEGRDDEGAPYYRTRLNWTDGTHVDLMESHDRARCEDVLSRYQAAVS